MLVDVGVAVAAGMAMAATATAKTKGQEGYQRGEPLLDQHDSVPQFAGCLRIVYYVVSQVSVNNHPECLM